MLFHVATPIVGVRNSEDVTTLCNTLTWYIAGLMSKNNGMLPDYEVITGRTYAEIVSRCCRIARMTELPLLLRIEQLNIIHAFAEAEDTLGHSGLVSALVTLPVISTSVAVILQADSENFEEAESYSLWCNDNDLRNRMAKFWMEILCFGVGLEVRDAAVQTVQSKMIPALRRWSLTASATRLGGYFLLAPHLISLTRLRRFGTGRLAFVFRFVGARVASLRGGSYAAIFSYVPGGQWAKGGKHSILEGSRYRRYAEFPTHLAICASVLHLKL